MMSCVPPQQFGHCEGTQGEGLPGLLVGGDGDHVDVGEQSLLSIPGCSYDQHSLAIHIIASSSEEWPGQIRPDTTAETVSKHLDRSIKTGKWTGLSDLSTSVGRSSA